MLSHQSLEWVEHLSQGTETDLKIPTQHRGSIIRVIHYYISSQTKPVELNPFPFFCLTRCQTRLTLISLQNLGLPNWSSPLWVLHFSTQSRLKRPTTIKSSSLWYSHCLFYFSSHQKFRPIEYHIFIGIRTGQDRTDLWTFFLTINILSKDLIHSTNIYKNI